MRILLIKLSSIGDLVHTIPAYRALETRLKNSYPDLEIDWLVYKHLAPTLYKSINKNNLIEIEKNGFWELVQEGSKLKNKYNYVVDLQGLFKTALVSKIIAPNSNYGFNQPRETWARYFYKDGFCEYKSIESKKHVIDQNLELVSKFASKVLSHQISSDIDFGLEANKHVNEKKSICFIPATTWESKHWSLENWTELINSMGTDFNFYLTGTKSDLEYLNKLANSTDKEIEIIIDKKLEDLYDFYSEMDCVIGVDTGPLHIAAAALYKNKSSKYIMGIYGPSSGSRSGPYGFTAISADELFDLKASNKKTYLKDRETINRIKPEHILKELSKVKV